MLPNENRTVYLVEAALRPIAKSTMTENAT